MSIQSKVMLLLLIKHWICDFYLQRPYQYRNKGIYGHPGGILHALITILGTLVVLFFVPRISFLLMMFILGSEFLIHYHMDFAKIRFARYMNWSMTTHESWWWLLGFDQFIHLLNYILIVELITK